MKLSPEHAQKVLDADVRNIVKKVSEGGILSATERAMVQSAAFPNGEEKAKRAVALALKYSSGQRLTALELGEIREVHPDFAPEAVASDTPAASGQDLSLTCEPSPARGDGKVTTAQLAKWAKMYGCDEKGRQIRRWIERGKQVGEPCPLDEPAKMLDWIERNLEKVRGALRGNIMAAAAAAEAAAPPPPAETKDQSPAATTAPAAAAAAAARVAPLDLGSVGGVEGESVMLFRTLFAATKKQLEEAYAAGHEDRINRLTTRIEKTGESLRKHEIAAEQRARRRGDLLEKSEVINSITGALNTFRLMREARVKRVLSELTGLPPETVEKLASVLNDIGQREESCLARLPYMKTPDDVLNALAA